MIVAIIGCGASGSFCAIELKRRLPSARVEVFESKRKALAKVAVTGGGRCNLTNSFEGVTNLSQAYPRGDKLMKRVFRNFDHTDTWKWFESEGVALTLQEDNCVFPASQDAMEIVDLLLKRMKQLGVALHTGRKVTAVYSRNISAEGGETGPTGSCANAVPDKPSGPDQGAAYVIRSEGFEDFEADIVVVTTGGSPRLSGMDLLDGLDLEIVPPVPSLFSFNIPDKDMRSLMGTVVENAAASLVGTGFKASGPLLVTHWGMSGPAILRLSSYAARHLAENGHKSRLSVNWLGLANENDARNELEAVARENSKKLISNCRPTPIPSRLWLHLLAKTGIRDGLRWAELGSKGMNRIVNILVNDTYEVSGKSRHTEEFVTCGGVSLTNIDFSSLECKTHKGLFFAGEALDVDAVTGGFNLQAAWSTGWLVAKSIAAGWSPEDTGERTMDASWSVVGSDPVVEDIQKRASIGR